MSLDVSTAFISYCRVDSAFAHRLVEDLKRADVNVWLDQLDIQAGATWDTSIQQALESCSCLVVILSPASVKRENVLNEIVFALEKGKRVVPLLYQDCETPLQIRRYQRIDFRSDYSGGLASLIDTLAGEGQRAKEQVESPARWTAKLAKFCKSRLRLVTALVLLLVIAVSLGVFLLLRWRQRYRPSTEVTRIYEEGLSSLRKGNYIEASYDLERASEKDPRFVMAHVRHAEATYNLDFQQSALNEIAKVSQQREGLSSLEVNALDAVYATITGDFSKAIQDYSLIVKQSPAEEKSAALVDLGFAYERSGDTRLALQNYELASKEDSSNPSGFVHTAVLSSRMHDLPAATLAFKRADEIVGGQMNNTESHAELNYQRGFAANLTGDSDAAKVYLQRAIQEARVLSQTPVPSDANAEQRAVSRARKFMGIRLEVRALTQLSDAEFNSAGDEVLQQQPGRPESPGEHPSVRDAKLAVELANAHALPIWAAKALIKEASAYSAHQENEAAEKALEDAEQLLVQNPEAMLEAGANLVRANIANQRRRTADVVAPAQLALAYYQKNGYFFNARSAALLLTRAQGSQEHFKQALAAGEELSAVAHRIGDPKSMALSDELLGSIALRTEDYPRAMSYYKRAMEEADTKEIQDTDALDYAQSQLRLGYFAEAETTLAPLRKSKTHEPDVDEKEIESLMGRQLYKQAIAMAQQLVAKNPTLDPDDLRGIEQMVAQAQAHVGLKKQALEALTKYVEPDRGRGTALEAAQDRLVAADIYHALGMEIEAVHWAQIAAKTFETTDGGGRTFLDSRLRCAAISAIASRTLKDATSYKLYFGKTIDIQNMVKQDWGLPHYSRYVAKPDLRSLVARSEVISGA